MILLFWIISKKHIKLWKRKIKKIILTGDFNFNLLKFEKNKEVNEFLEFLAINWLSLQILGPTRVTAHERPSLIDNIIINFHDLHCSSGNLIEKISDHFPNFLIIFIETIKVEELHNTKVKKRDYSNFDSDKLRPWEFISQFLVLRPHVVLIPHEKFHYFENFHYFRKNAFPCQILTQKNKLITFKNNTHIIMKLLTKAHLYLLIVFFRMK